MKRSRDVLDDQVVDPPLNLPLTIRSELINSIETCPRESYTCSSQQTSSSNTSSPPEKLKALNFPISKITIGDWTYDSTNPEDIVAKFYFAKKKLLWEFLGHAESETYKLRLKIKIEMQWDDVLSFQGSFNSRDETGILKIELKKRPTFFEETNPQPGKHTQWKQLDSDFTSDQAARCRIHTLHFQPGVLQKNFEKLMSISFWSELYYKVRFPSQEAIYFDDIGYGSNNNNAINNSSGHIPSQTPRFYAHSNQHLHSQANSLNNTANEFGTQAQPGTYLAGNSNQHLHSQGIIREGVGEGNFYSATQSLDNDGWQNSCSQANSPNNTATEFGTEPPPGSYLAGLILDEEMHTTLRWLEKRLMSDDSNEIEDDSNDQGLWLCWYMDQ